MSTAVTSDLAVLLAQLTVRHTRPASPVRRIAIGEFELPSDEVRSDGSLLLAGIVGAFAPQLSDDARDEIDVLLDQLGRGNAIRQPQMRHRLQVDTVGLDASRHRLLGAEQHRELLVDAKGFDQPLPQVLVASYALVELGPQRAWANAQLLRRALRWQGGDTDRLMEWLHGGHDWTSRSSAISEDQWARDLLGFDQDGAPNRIEILRRFRMLVRDAHPDAGGDSQLAAKRITELGEARRILAQRS